jgi:hypothetical protein
MVGDYHKEKRPMHEVVIQKTNIAIRRKRIL